MRKNFIYYLAAPLRLFGRSHRFRLLLGAVVVVAVFFAGTLWILDRLFPTDALPPEFANLPSPPPLPPISRSSEIVTPVAISLTAIRDALDAAAPRQFSGENNNPVSRLLSKAEIGVSVARGPMAVSGQNRTLTVTAPLTGSVKITGQLGAQTGQAVGDAIGNLLGGSFGRQVGDLTQRALNQTQQFRGDVVVTARPTLKPDWRLEPNLGGQLKFSDTGATIAGLKVNLAGEIEPLLNPIINDQINTLGARLRNDPFIERAAREQWIKMCRSIPLGGGNTGIPNLWLEMKPTRAYAAQPQIDNKAVTLTVGVRAETRILAATTKPSCPFPAKIDIVPAADKGKLAIGVPIDVPFTAVNKLLEAQLKGRTYPEDGSGPAEVTVRGVHVAAAGDRLLISLKVKVVEKKSWFGFGAGATVNIWGKPVLDSKKQILRLADISLAVNSNAAYGLLNAAARAAVPYLQQALAERAVVDLKPFAADALKKIDVALADFKTPAPGTRVDAAARDLRLTGIAFDAHTLRIIAEATGSVNVAVTKLPAF
jgi:hypothetical protein